MGQCREGLGRLIKGIQAGDSFKLAVADALAGDFDRDLVLAEALRVSRSAPVVVFTWSASPACKKALKLLSLANVEPLIHRLDAPWDKGNQMRSVLGRLNRKTSVPQIYIGGTYVGGCDDGSSDEAPGIVSLSFQSRLNPALVAAGAFASSYSAPVPVPVPALALAPEETEPYRRQAQPPSRETPTSEPVLDECPSDGQCEID